MLENGLENAREKMEQALRERLETNYEEYISRLREKTPDELIRSAGEIAVAEYIYKELSSGRYGEYAGYLLRFASPLDVVRDHWQSCMSYDLFDEVSHMLWDMQDKEIGIGDYPLAGQPAEETGRQGVVMC